MIRADAIRSFIVMGAVMFGATGSAPAYTETSLSVYRAIGIKQKDVMNGTILSGAVMPGREKQVVALTTYFTGHKAREDAVNVRLDIFRRVQNKLVSIYHRDFGKDNNGNVGRGELQLIDLDMDGVNEIIVTYDNHEDILINERLGEIIIRKEEGFATAWSGTMEYDATRSARDVPLERRDRYIRTIDFEETMRTKGVTLFLNKTMIAIAGERLPEPKTVQETFPLKKSSTGW